MIIILRQLSSSEFTEAYEFIKQDNARNYFIRLGFEGDRPVYDEIIGQYSEGGSLEAVLFRRKSGNLHFYAPGEFDTAGFADYITKMKFDALISPASYCDKLLGKNLFIEIKGGAIIARLAKENLVAAPTDASEVEVLSIEDLDEVTALYEKVFPGFSSKSVMEKRLATKRGRGVCIRHEGRIITVVQSEFETDDSAMIVGVATYPEFQRRGLANKCLKALCPQLQQEGKDLYLIYDNIEAGKIYEKLGFRTIDQIKHYIGHK